MVSFFPSVIFYNQSHLFSDTAFFVVSVFGVFVAVFVFFVGVFSVVAVVFVFVLFVFVFVFGVLFSVFSVFVLRAVVLRWVLYLNPNGTY